MTIIVVGQPNLFPFLTQIPLNQSSALGLILTLTGFSTLSAGFILAVHYERKRSWHLAQIEKSTTLKNRKITVKTANELIEELTDEKK